MSDEWNEYDDATRVEKEGGSVPPPSTKPEPPKEVIKEIPVEHEKVTKVTETKQVPVRDTVIEKVEVIKEVPIDREVIKEVPVEKIVYKDPKPGTKVTCKEINLGPLITWALGGIIVLLVIFGGKWAASQSFENIFKEPKTITKKIMVPGKSKIKWKTKWKTRKIVDKSLVRENRRLKENLATAKNRIDRLLAEIARPKQYTCRYSHRLKVIHSKK